MILPSLNDKALRPIFHPPHTPPVRLGLPVIYNKQWPTNHRCIHRRLLTINSVCLPLPVSEAEAALQSVRLVAQVLLGRVDDARAHLHAEVLRDVEV